MATTIEEIEALVNRLSPDRQQKVLEFAQRLVRISQTTTSLQTTPLPAGTPGAELLTTLLSLKVQSEDVEAMERAIEDCERVEPDEY